MISLHNLRACEPILSGTEVLDRISIARSEGYVSQHTSDAIAESRHQEVIERLTARASTVTLSDTRHDLQGTYRSRSIRSSLVRVQRQPNLQNPTSRARFGIVKMTAMSRELHAS